MNAVQELKAVKELIKEKKSWCKGAFATDAQGNSVVATALDACRFCVEGAIRHVTRRNYGNPSYLYITGVVRTSVCHWNDRAETTHEHVMKVLDKAIDNAEKDQNVQY